MRDLRRDDPDARSDSPTVPRAVIIGVGWLGIAVARDLLATTDVKLLLLDHESRTPPLRDALDDSRVRWLSPVDPGRLPEDAHNTFSTAMAVISCSDGPAVMPATLLDWCGHDVPLVVAELTVDGARLQVVPPGHVDSGCPGCSGALRASRDLVTAAADAYAEATATTTVPWRYRHDDADLAIAARFVTLAIGTTLAAARDGGGADYRSCVVDFESRTASAHRVRRHPACRRCHPRATRGADALREQALERWNTAWETVRPPRDLIEIGETLRPLVDADSGLFESCRMNGGFDRRAIAAFLDERGVKGHDTPFLDAVRAVVARSRTRLGRLETVLAEGFDFVDPRIAEALALVEGIERLSAFDDLDRSRLTRASYASIDHVALDPRELPLFSEAQYDTPDFPFQRFDPEGELDWVCGIRLNSGEPVFVPADVIRGRAQGRLMRATTNGAACHSSLHHAVLNGLYEVVERDALMTAWLQTRSCPRVRVPADATDPHGVRAAFARMSFELTYCDLTTALGFPVMLAVLEDREDPDFFLCTMAANLSRSSLLGKLHRELAQFSYPHLVDRESYRTPLSASHDATGVRSLPDHLAFYQHRSKRPLTAFLTASADERELTIPAEYDAPIEDELQQVLTRLTAGGYEPIAVDCTLPLLRELEMWAVKVIVPGLQPLHVGHGQAPLGGTRVVGPVNPWPHPFW